MPGGSMRERPLNPRSPKNKAVIKGANKKMFPLGFPQWKAVSHSTFTDTVRTRAPRSPQ